MERRNRNTQRNKVPSELQPLVEVNPNVLVYADISERLLARDTKVNEGRCSPQFPEVKKAFFFLNQEGQQCLRIFAYTNDYTETVKLEGDMGENLKGSMFREVVWYCLKVGFQAETFPVDNRTELQYVEDYDEYARVTAALHKKPLGYEKWRDTQVLSF